MIEFKGLLLELQSRTRKLLLLLQLPDDTQEASD